jgi:hypothetical protein
VRGASDELRLRLSPKSSALSIILLNSLNSLFFPTALLATSLSHKLYVSVCVCLLLSSQLELELGSDKEVGESEGFKEMRRNVGSPAQFLGQQ